MVDRLGYILSVTLFALALNAQHELHYIMPAGGSAGSQVEVEVSTDASVMQRMLISGSGVAATYLGPVKTTVTNAKGKRVEQVVAGRFRFRVTIEPDAEPGVREARIGSKTMLSAPLPFEVATLHEIRTAGGKKADEVLKLEQMPLYLNGLCHKTPVLHRFTAPEAAEIVAYCDKRAGGWSGAGVPEITFYNDAGGPCVDVKSYDAPLSRIVVMTTPAAGNYTLQVAADKRVKQPIRSAYRIRLGALPLITGFKPATARAGESLNVRLQGYNLTQQRVRLFTGGKDSALCEQALAGEALLLPGVSFELQREETPDFALFMEPATVHLPGNGSAALTIHARRSGGFVGEIKVEPDYPPLSIICEGGVISVGADKCMMTISTEGVRYPRVPFALTLSGSGEINGAETLRPVQVVQPVPIIGEGEVPWRSVSDCLVQTRVGAYAIRINPGKLASRSPRLVVDLPVTYSVPQPLTLGKETVLSLTSASLAEALAAREEYELFMLWPDKGFSIKVIPNKEPRGEVEFAISCDKREMKVGDKGFLIIGCRKKGATAESQFWVSQSMPYLIK